MAEASKRAPLAEVRFKRAARYLVGCPVTEWHCLLQGHPSQGGRRATATGQERMTRSPRSAL
eukprot:1710369-Pyramimonas_sp.AAC.1